MAGRPGRARRPGASPSSQGGRGRGGPRPDVGPSRNGSRSTSRLAANGVGLSRSVLIKALWEREIEISADRAIALLAAPHHDPESADRSR